MKQVIFLLAAAIFFGSCNRSEQVVKCDAEQIKMKLLKQAGFDKMDKTFTYDYAVQNDSVVAMLSFVPDTGIINFNEAGSSKGMLLNVFMMPDGRQYSTTLKRGGGGLYQVGVQILNGVELPEYVYVELQPGGNPGDHNPPPTCGDGNCSADCLWTCRSYFTYVILPGLQKRADSLCKPVRYCYSCPVGACGYIAGAIFPNSRYCNFVFNDPARIAIQKLTRGLVIKNTTPKHEQ